MWAVVWILVCPAGGSTTTEADNVNGVKQISIRKIDLNRATVSELTTLPGIGKITAQRIVEFREKNGPFQRIEELLIIRGISEKKLKAIQERLTIGAPGGSRKKD